MCDSPRTPEPTYRSEPFATSLESQGDSFLREGIEPTLSQCTKYECKWLWLLLLRILGISCSVVAQLKVQSCFCVKYDGKIGEIIYTPRVGGSICCYLPTSGPSDTFAVSEKVSRTERPRRAIISRTSCKLDFDAIQFDEWQMSIREARNATYRIK